jgi:hypothetical protein
MGTVCSASVASSGASQLSYPPSPTFRELLIECIDSLPAELIALIMEYEFQYCAYRAEMIHLMDKPKRILPYVCGNICMWSRTSVNKFIAVRT